MGLYDVEFAKHKESNMKEALKDGFDVPGAKLVHGQRLDIK